MNAVTQKYASTNFISLMTKVIDNSEPTYICNDSGDGVVVLNSDDYNALEETLYLLSTEANRDRLTESINEHKKGNTFKIELIEE